MTPTPSKFAKVINSLFTWIFVLYFISVLLPNIVHPAFLNTFLSTPLMSKVVQFKGVPFVLYFVLVVIANKKMPHWQSIVCFSLLGIYTLIVMFLAPRDQTFYYVSDTGAVTPHEIVVTLSDQFSLYGSYLFGIIYAFCLFYLAPITGDHGKTKTIVIWFLILIALFSCLYSYVSELDKYKIFLSGEAKNKWVLDIRSLYANKNRFGSILFAGFCASFLVSISAHKWLRPIGVFLAFYFTLSCYLIRCDDAFLSCGVGWIVFVIVLLAVNRKEHWLLCTIFLSLFLGLAGFSICAVSLPSIYTKFSFFQKVHDFLGQINGASGRFGIWINYLSHLSNLEYLFGMGKIGYFINNVVSGNEVEELSLHNGALDFFNVGGIVFVIYLVWLLAKSLKIVSGTAKDYPLIFAALLAIYCAFLIYGFAETFTPFTARFINTAAISYLLSAWANALPHKTQPCGI